MVEAGSVEWYLAWFFGGMVFWFGMKLAIWIDDQVHSLHRKVKKE